MRGRQPLRVQPAEVRSSFADAEGGYCRIAVLFYGRTTCLIGPNATPILFEDVTPSPSASALTDWPRCGSQRSSAIRSANGLTAMAAAPPGSRPRPATGTGRARERDRKCQWRTTVKPCSRSASVSWGRPPGSRPCRTQGSDRPSTMVAPTGIVRISSRRTSVGAVDEHQREALSRSTRQRDGLLIPLKKNQPAPDLRYFKQARK